MLRIALILAILAGLGVIGVSQFLVKPHIEQIITQRNEFEAEKNKQFARANKAEKELKETKATLAETTKKLQTTENQLHELRDATARHGAIWIEQKPI